jgi:hypothetical protein
MREDYYAGLEDRYFLTYDQAKEQKLKIDFDAAPPAAAPNKVGVTVIDSHIVCKSSSVLKSLSSFFIARRTRSSKHGSYAGATRIAAIQKSSMMKLSEVRPKSSLMMLKSL